MAAAYSMDLRSRVLRDCDAGLSSNAAAARYHVSRAWVDALKQRRRETGAILARGRPNRKERKLKLDHYRCGGKGLTKLPRFGVCCGTMKVTRLAPLSAIL